MFTLRKSPLFPVGRHLPTTPWGHPRSIRKLPKPYRKLPNSMRKLPESLRKLPNSIWKLPESFRKLPNSIWKLPEPFGNFQIQSGNFLSLSGNFLRRCENSVWVDENTIRERGIRLFLRKIIPPPLKISVLRASVLLCEATIFAPYLFRVRKRTLSGLLLFDSIALFLPNKFLIRTQQE